MMDKGDQTYSTVQLVQCKELCISSNYFGPLSWNQVLHLLLCSSVLASRRLHPADGFRATFSNIDGQLLGSTSFAFPSHLSQTVTGLGLV